MVLPDLKITCTGSDLVCVKITCGMCTLPVIRIWWLIKGNGSSMLLIYNRFTQSRSMHISKSTKSTIQQLLLRLVLAYWRTHRIPFRVKLMTCLVGNIDRYRRYSCTQVLRAQRRSQEFRIRNSLKGRKDSCRLVCIRGNIRSGIFFFFMYVWAGFKECERVYVEGNFEQRNQVNW